MIGQNCDLGMVDRLGHLRVHRYLGSVLPEGGFALDEGDIRAFSVPICFVAPETSRCGLRDRTPRIALHYQAGPAGLLLYAP